MTKLAYTIREASDATGFSEAAIREALHGRGPLPPLPHLLNGSRYLIPVEALRDWISQQVTTS